jgi:hypothetical protein
MKVILWSQHWENKPSVSWQPNQIPGSSSSLELVQLELDISNLLKVLTTFSLVSDPNPEGFVSPERYLHANLNVLLRNHG